MRSSRAVKSMERRCVFHYTAWEKLPAIVETGELRPSNAAAETERPLLWFSANQRWEPTATKFLETAEGIRRLTFEEQESHFGCVRFGLSANDRRIRSWKAACEYAGTSQSDRKALERAGQRLNARCADWFAVSTSIPFEYLTFEVWMNECWHPADATEMAAVWLDAR